MENEPMKRPPPSGIPRLSRLPLPTTSTSKTVRPSPSRERLQADQGLNVSRLRRPSEDVFKKPSLPPPSSRKIPEMSAPQRRSSLRTSSVKSCASTDNLSNKRSCEAYASGLGPSLEERTVETLAQMPPSPVPSRRQSSFFRPSSPTRPPSRTSDLAQDPSTQILSPSRKPSYRTLSGIDPPQLKPTAKARGASYAPSYRRVSENNFKQQPSVTTNKTGASAPRIPPRSESKNVALRSSKSRNSLAQSFNQLSTETDKSIGTKRAPKPRVSSARMSSATRSSNLTSPTSTASKFSQSTAITSNSNRSEESKTENETTKTSKSSNALRESIAKAKAARKAARQNNAAEGGFEHTDDPFNMLQTVVANGAVLKNRAATGRKSGVLNIAALGLKEIPKEILTMYDYDPESSDKWYEAVDLAKLIASDNEFESLPDNAFPDIDISSMNLEEENKGNQFGGLELLDLHGNLLASLPLGLRWLQRLHSLNVAKNKLNMDAIEVVTQIRNLVELKLGNNDLEGMLTPQLGSLQNLELLDLRGNALTGLPDNLSDLTALRVLNVSENQLTSLPFSALSKLPLVEISAQKNRLQGNLIPASIQCIKGLQLLNVSGNSLEGLSAGDSLELPSLQQLFADSNRIKSLPNISTWNSLLTLMLEDNDLSEIPQGLPELRNLKHSDLKGNNITALDDKIGLMDSLSTFRIENNPLRERKFLTMDTEILKRELRTRCEPEIQEADDAEGSVHTEFTLAPETPQTTQAWRVKTGGVLDRSSTGLSRLEVEDIEPLLNGSDIRCLYLQRNQIQTLPVAALSLLSRSLTDLDLSHNPIDGDGWLTAQLEFPHLQNLTLTSAGLKSFESLQSFLIAPMLTFLDVSNNRLNGNLPVMRGQYPNLITLLAADNQIISLSFEAVQGLQVLDVSNNNIDHLPPRLGLLGIEDGLRSLDVSGNSFRVPRWQVVAKGTEAVLDWLKTKITPDEMKEWSGDTDDL